MFKKCSRVTAWGFGSFPNPGKNRREVTQSSGDRHTFHVLDELIEQIPAVVRTRGSFWMVLD
jgi:hypothetical protein